MRRERIRTTREDGTGFAQSVRSGQGRAPLGAISDVALMEFEGRPDGITAPSGGADHAGLNAIAAPPEPGLNADPAATSGNDPETGSSERAALTDLVLPPRANAMPDSIALTLRLRVLPRHAAFLRAREERGGNRREILQSALRRITPLIFVPRYVPQPAEPGAASEWGHRCTIRIPVASLKAIEAQVRGGASVPRAPLILGQIEPLWFASLDALMAEGG